MLPKNRHVHFCTIGPGTNARFLHGLSWRWDTTGNGSDRQTVLRASSDDSVLDRQGNQGPKLSAALMDKAADVKSKVDELGVPLDLTPLAPDIEPPPT